MHRVCHIIHKLSFPLFSIRSCYCRLQLINLSPNKMSSDDEKWNQMVGDSAETLNGKSSQTKINLQKLKPDEVKESQRKTKSKKRLYFIVDCQTMLSDEDINYQLLNTSDIVTENPKVLSRLSKQKLKKETPDKLLKFPERNLSPKLDRYYSKNLKMPAKLPDDMDISYDEIEKDVLRTVQFCKKRKTSEQHSRLKDSILSTTIKEEDDDEDYKTPIQIGKFETTIEKVKIESATIKKESVLKTIDTDFKATVLIGTKSYSRKRTK